MHAHFRTVVTFTSKAFNVTKPKDYFINECCFGDDVATLAATQIRDVRWHLQSDFDKGLEDRGAPPPS